VIRLIDLAQISVVVNGHVEDTISYSAYLRFNSFRPNILATLRGWHGLLSLQQKDSSEHAKAEKLA